MSITPSAHVESRLQKEPILWLSTVRPDGRPHLVPVWFLWDSETILIFSKSDQKIRNLRDNPQVMVALEAADEGEAIVMIEGVAELSTGELTPELPAYTEKYAVLMPKAKTPGAQMAAAFTQVIRITPTRLRAWGGE